MTQTTAAARKGVFRAAVIYNQQQNPTIYRLGLRFGGAGAEAFKEVMPGAFAELDIQDASLPPLAAIPDELHGKARRRVLLRRPFSFSQIEPQGDETLVEVVYAVLGPGTLRLTTLKSGDTLSVLGPLGQGFTIKPKLKYALLVGGGLGTPPIEHLARILMAQYPKIKTTVFCGARSIYHLPFQTRQHPGDTSIKLEELEDIGVAYQIATDNGSAGIQGFVTDLMEQWLKDHPDAKSNNTQVFTCGPEPMLARVASIAQAKNLPCQVSLERNMACGINLCQGCAVECKSDQSEETVFKMCCQDGPVFDAQDVVWP